MLKTSLEEFQDAVGEFHHGEVVGGMFCNDMLENFDAPHQGRKIVGLLQLETGANRACVPVAQQNVVRHLENFDKDPVEYRAAVALIMLHEQALLRFDGFEIMGETECSLDDVNTQLRWPRAIPVKLGNT